MRWLLAVLALGLPLHAGDAGLAALSKALVSIRETRKQESEVRGATPQFTLAKHQLRDWIESKLVTFPGPDNDARDFALGLNRLLKEAGLECSDSDCEHENWFSGVGFLEDVQIKWQAGLLVVQTGIGIECGYDQSAYAYQRNEQGWVRRWQSEQNDYSKDKYHPQDIVSVEIGAGSNDKSYLLLTLGAQSWCASNWRDVYYRLWEMEDLRTPKLLLNKSEWAFVPERIRGSIERGKAFIEYAAQSRDSGVLIRKKVEHIAVSNGTAKRIDPIALGPRDFVDEWLSRPWPEMKNWSEAPSLELKQKQVEKLDTAFRDSTLHCSSPDLWQVEASFDSDGKPQTKYFLVRWKPPYHFTMAAIADKPWPKCTEKDPDADEPRTLFPH